MDEEAVEAGPREAPDRSARRRLDAHAADRGRSRENSSGGSGWLP